MTFELGRALLLSGTVTPESLSRALAATVEPGMPLSRALVGLGLVSEADLEAELARSDYGPAVTELHPTPELLADLPTGLCHRLAALPIQLNDDGTVDVAVLDARDGYVAEEMSFHLHHPVRLVRAAYGAMREALANYSAAVRASVPPPGLRRERRRALSFTPAWGTPIQKVTTEIAAEALPSAPPPPHASGSVASVTTSTRRFFAGMHTAEPFAPDPGAAPSPPPVEEAHLGHEPVFELRRGPHMTLHEIEPPTIRLRDAPAFPLVASLPSGVPTIPADAIPLPFHDPAATLAQLRVAEDRDEVLGLLEKSARTVARRVALLVVKKEGVTGWSCSPEFGDVTRLKGLQISLKNPSLLNTVLAGGVYLGPLLGSVGTAFLQVMRTATRDVAMVAARVKERPAVLIVCDELGDTLLATRHLDVMAKIAGEALERVLLSRRQSDA